LSKTAKALDDGTDRPIVVLEPSCAAALRKDLPELVHTAEARRVAARVRSFATHVEAMLSEGWRSPAPIAQSAVLQTHCHEYAVFGSTTQNRVLDVLGVKAQNASGCCGVAGNFGFERGHYEVSMQVADQALAPALRAADQPEAILADGFSCVAAVEHLRRTDPTVNVRAPMHLAELIDPAPPVSSPAATLRRSISLGENRHETVEQRDGPFAPHD
jgi:Fe-S oxidoreductase